MKKKYVWILLSLIIVTILLVVLKKAGIIGKNDGIKVTAEKASMRTLIQTVTASGKIYPEVEVKVSSDISGEIVQLNIDEGDSVHKGQVLAHIYADIYSTQRDQMRAAVDQAEAQRANAVSNLSGLHATYLQTKAAYERQQSLWKNKIIAQSEFEQSQQAAMTAEANFNAEKDNIRGLEASIQNAKAQLAKADKDLLRATILSPLTGVVSLLSVKQGERVVGTAQMTGTEMMRIADMKSIEAQVNVAENDIPKVKIGDTALVEVDAYNARKFKGIVYQIANPATASAVTSTTDVTNYTVHIRLFPSSYEDLMPTAGNHSFPFRPGMTASADIQTKIMDNVLSIPLSAVTVRIDEPSSTDKKKNDNTKPTTASNEVVFILQKNGTVKKVPVITGIQDLNYIQITTGLNDSAEVITSPYSVVSKTLKDGTKVRVVRQELLYDDKK